MIVAVGVCCLGKLGVGMGGGSRFSDAETICGMIDVA